jgi:hypothetical protein
VGVATGTAAPSWPLFTAGAAPSGNFTADSREVLFVSGSDLFVVPAKGGTPRLMASGVWGPNNGGYLLPVLYPYPHPVHNSRFLVVLEGTANPAVYDAEGAAPAFTLVNNPVSWRITADSGTLIYVVKGTYAGLYVAPIP